MSVHLLVSLYFVYTFSLYSSVVMIMTQIKCIMLHKRARASIQDQYMHNISGVVPGNWFSVGGMNLLLSAGGPADEGI